MMGYCLENALPLSNVSLYLTLRGKRLKDVIVVCATPLACLLFSLARIVNLDLLSTKLKIVPLTSLNKGVPFLTFSFYQQI